MHLLVLYLFPGLCTLNTIVVQSHAIPPQQAHHLASLPFPSPV